MEAVIHIKEDLEARSVSKKYFEDFTKEVDLHDLQIKALQLFKEEITQKVVDDHYSQFRVSQDVSDLKISFELNDRNLTRYSLHLKQKVDLELFE